MCDKLLPCYTDKLLVDHFLTVYNSVKTQQIRYSKYLTLFAKCNFSLSIVAVYARRPYPIFDV